MVQAISYRPLTAKAWVQYQSRPCVICSGCPWQRDRVFLRVLQIYLSVPFHESSIFVFIYTLLLPRQTSETWVPSEQQCSFGNRRALDREWRSLFFLLQGVDFRGYIVAHNNYVWKEGYWKLPSWLDLSYSIDVRNADTFRNTLYIANFRGQVSTGHTFRWKQCSSCPKGVICRCKM
jgi:hypothetical protein